MLVVVFGYWRDAVWCAVEGGAKEDEGESRYRHPEGAAKSVPR